MIRVCRHFTLRVLRARSEESQPCLDARGQGMEIADALNFVIREFDAKMIFQSREEFEGLQAVDSKLLVEIIAWPLAQSAREPFEMCGGQIQNFVSGLFDGFHDSFYPITSSSPRQATGDRDALQYFLQNCAIPA